MKNWIMPVDWEMWEMKHFGDFVSNLRGSAGLSLEALATLVESSKSTLSRLENGDIPQPFKGPTRKLVIALAEILCTSKKETKRYLELAGFDQSLLTEAEEIQLGFAPPFRQILRRKQRPFSGWSVRTHSCSAN